MANTQNESIEQVKIVHWVRYHTDLPIYANINQGKRSYRDANILKRMGMTAGVPDLFIMRATPEYHGCYLEVKSGSGKVSPQQQHFINRALKEGYFAAAVWNAEAGIEIIRTIYQIQASQIQI